MTPDKQEILAKQIEEQYTLFSQRPEVPGYITENLSHGMRDYQTAAIENLIFTQQNPKADEHFNHLLFHMATGSGKTLILASSILYMFKEHGYQNFLFFVNTDGIVKKTIDNLTNEKSPKYLFRKEGIIIDNRRIEIVLVDIFPSTPAPNTIYLKVSTIQKLHLDLTEPRENSMTYQSLEEMDIVLLADEAHHINASTRKKGKMTVAEAEAKTWEKTIERLLALRNKNRLLEYTATVTLTDDNIFNKYRSKIVFQYDLKKFMKDGYSKNVMLLRATENDDVKMLHAVLLSQYRKYIAKEYGIDIKPIILFKSNKVDISKKANERLLQMIRSMTSDTLENLIKKGIETYQNEKNIWGKAFRYFKTLDSNKIVFDLKFDFTETTTPNMNDSSQTSLLSEGNASLLNTLEEANNPVRAIFAVAKLNEGWDVLNLYDIVRISEGSSDTKKATDSEAQLIGRGARYYPFLYKDKVEDKRRFDDYPSPLKAIETLHYHTINDSAYLKSLEKSLREAQITVKEAEAEPVVAKLKTNFKNHHIYKHGKIYINRLVPTSITDYDNLSKYQVSTNFEVPLEVAVEQKIDKSLLEGSVSTTKEYQWKPEKRFIRKALQRNPFFHFRNLKNYVPSINSIREFIEKDSFLGQLTIYFILPSGIELTDLSPIEKLNAVESFLKYAEKKIRNNYMKERGTPVFEGVAFSKLIDDYYLEINKVNRGVSDVSEIKEPRSMRGKDWFVYDKAIVNQLEDDMIDFVQSYVEELKETYKNVFLIRNERSIKIVEIDGVRGFMPDFLLYLQDDEVTYQVFLEPKGGHLIEKDRWKQNFLEELNKRDIVQVLSENDNVRLIGIKFYSNSSEQKAAFRDDFKEKLLEGR
ncbi:DEAD/DEAH box helicase family protein [Halobacillus sp. BAB-2008]|uniref:DEAD/DEAH box helicase family protein n=1 Tax=Halobacillus sp. BAB-2008 TaxID=1246484 RepID=UPI0002A51B1D|nr:DEAD/DEAH box helicase family protein [Halobacillus sp. BAB-2008]ELK46164.1 hypothetical protein D479_11678 [Halobacillus sp. BAB-2008]